MSLGSPRSSVASAMCQLDHNKMGVASELARRSKWFNASTQLLTKTDRSLR